MVYLQSIVAAATLLVHYASAASVPKARSLAQLPLSVDGPNMVDSTGAVVKYAGTNWPGHGQVMIPEGLQYRSVEGILTDLKGLGMNSIRLTFAIEMIDQIYDNDGEDIDLQTAFIDALGQDNGTTVLEQVLANNPQFTAATKRLEV
jgi:hypothetical protein